MRGERLVYILICFLLITGCSDSSGGNDDSIVPVISNPAIGYSKHLRGFAISWVKAEDETSDRENLEYRIVVSKNDNISTPEDIDANGTVAGDWSSDISSFDITNLEYQQDYFFNVLVRDEAGNAAAYSREQDKTDIVNNKPSAQITGHAYSTVTSSGVYAVKLSGKDSYDSDEPYDSVVSYLWDTDGDGNFGADDTDGSVNIGSNSTDAAGMDVSVSNSSWVTGTNVTISLKVRDELGEESNAVSFPIAVIALPSFPPVLEIQNISRSDVLSGNFGVQLVVAHPDPDYTKTIELSCLLNGSPISLRDGGGNIVTSVETLKDGEEKAATLYLDTTSYANGSSYILSIQGVTDGTNTTTVTTGTFEIEN